MLEIDSATRYRGDILPAYNNNNMYFPSTDGGWMEILKEEKINRRWRVETYSFCGICM